MPILRRLLFICALILVSALPAAAQARIAGPPAATVFVGPPAPKPVAKPGVIPGATPIRKPAVKPTPRPPRLVEALLARGANPKGAFARLNNAQRDSIVSSTRELIGVHYQWAGINPILGLDCSGVVKYVFAKLGIELPHHAADLAKLGGAVAKDTAAMEPGDLLVFGRGAAISHVGIYVGDGMMIHASSASRRVVETPVLTYKPAAGVQWQGVRRVVAHDTVATEGEPPHRSS